MSKGTFAIAVATMIYSGSAAVPSIAADYPERPVRVIVPGTPGGGPDVSARIIAAELTRQMGRQFIVDNRSGASGTIGIEILARATPDDYTIGQGSMPQLAIHRSILPKLSYDVDRDIQPIGQYSVGHSILVVALSLRSNRCRNCWITLAKFQASCCLLPMATARSRISQPRYSNA